MVLGGGLYNMNYNMSSPLPEMNMVSSLMEHTCLSVNLYFPNASQCNSTR